MNVSIITCTRNSMAYLPETIRSVQMQRSAAYEHIFVDGNSTDGTIEYINQLQGPIKLLTGVGGGISKAMNAGLLMATGDVIAHLHSDDYYLHADVLSLAINALTGGSGWAYGRIVRDIGGVHVPEGFMAPAYTKRRLHRGNFIPHPATFVRRDWFNKIGGFDESLKYAMDYDLWLKLSEVGDPVEIAGALAAFREHSGSLSTNNRLEALQEDYSVRQKHTGINVITRVENLARYLVRRNRVKRPTKIKTISFPN